MWDKTAKAIKGWKAEGRAGEREGKLGQGQTIKPFID